ncbi:MAG: thioredoxin domain-containing protein [Ignavibacteriales bacterium]|nr:MAG: thioredoxin domain-containing protein [Ignavibacteriaceae bacterium]MBW7871839.1 thioredoxin domain-containing protein [Ignavibacteria bacterium]MCZ2144311.1 thioredoxin domain-containing protein [Ignavibacteriales bacterium]OQY75988.1 MAG: hypothetical protein B6D45_04815 [Ignavibacteriales bacterium UTCHB3]MBV6446264.1 hypothetical protein [Ignavibacteriaceae bacterium]
MKKINTNRLINEKSPYLLQHAHNPVDWYPWGEEAFKKAEKEDKPIFLSIGYSTCHWCHVMEEESFEEAEVAGLLNENFVSIKVDREERPDIDAVYMAACQILTGSGGWPLTVLLKPDKKPFFAGTYFPRETAHGRLGIIELLTRVKKLWHEKRDDINESAAHLIRELKDHPRSSTLPEITTDLLEKAFNEFKERYDPDHGGFGTSPKFPSPHNLMFLLHYYILTGEPKALEMAEVTLISMRLGGIYDHLGNGFHRYSTDEEWRLPHFEKMLYDQATMIYAYAEAMKITGNRFYSEVIQSIYRYLTSVLRSPAGGFYSAEDADSDGEEGKFYIWSYAELYELLGDEFEEFRSIFPVEEHGNFIDRIKGGFTGENVIYLPEPLDIMAEKLNTNKDTLEARANYFKGILFERRKSRIHPHLDDKILTDWNGLLIAALARAGRYAKNPEYINTAAGISEFIEKHLKDNRRLLHRFREGEAGIEGFLDDYAFYSLGLIELYKATFNSDYLRLTIEYVEVLLNSFADDAGGFYLTPHHDEDLPARWKDVYDGAMPSGNSVMLRVLITLYHYTGKTDYLKAAEKLIRAFYPSVEKIPHAHSFFLAALEPLLYPAYELVIVGERDNKEIKAALVELTKPAYTNVAVLLKDSANSEKLENFAPFTKGMNTGDTGCFFYLCSNSVCELPVPTAKELFFKMEK